MARVLVTGSSGRIGRSAVAALAAGHRVTGFDRLPPPAGGPAITFVRGQLTDPVALYHAAQGQDCVIHLAAAPDDDPTPEHLRPFPDDADNFVSDLVPANVVGTYHVLKAAVRAGVPRVILASSGQVIDGHLADEHSRVTADSPFAPRYLYAATKVFTEAVGRVFAREHGLAVLAVRLGWCPRPGQEAAIRAEPLAPYVYVSGGDVGRFFAAAVASDDWPRGTDPDGKPLAYGVAYVTSHPPGGREVYDLGPARRLGYAPDPADDWAAWLRANG
jgi:nucleoside-diphosphate-sugar epimerase